MKEPLAQTMTRVVVTCSEADTVSDLMERMTHGRFRHIPVWSRTAWSASSRSATWSSSGSARWSANPKR